MLCCFTKHLRPQTELLELEGEFYGQLKVLPPGKDVHPPANHGMFLPLCFNAPHVIEFTFSGILLPGSEGLSRSEVTGS